VTPGWMLLLGLMHGLQPDHAAAATAMGARRGAAAWRAAARLAGGHAAALLLLTLLLSRVPSARLTQVEKASGIAGGLTLAAIGIVLVFQAIRSRYVLHAHAHRHGAKDHAHLHTHPLEEMTRHEHGHLSSIVGVGFLLGMTGARGLAMMLPNMMGPSSVLVPIALYATGVAAGSMLVSAAIDLMRARLVALGRWLDLGSGLAAVWFGVRIAWQA
jgi:hypothetical protein